MLFYPDYGSLSDQISMQSERHMAIMQVDIFLSQQMPVMI